MTGVQTCALPISQAIKFTQIADVVAKTLSQFSVSPADQLEAILAADQKSRVVAQSIIKAY